MTARKTLMSWSSGKDSAWALGKLQHDPAVDVVGLFCTVSESQDRVTMHDVRVELLHEQARSIGLPLEILRIPSPCSNKEYERIMGGFVDKARAEGVELIGYGDLALGDVRHYRERMLRGTGIEPIFPIWGMPTGELALEMVDGGLKTVVICIDPKQMPAIFIGKVYDRVFLDALPRSVDPCGENGEFHTFVFDGPMFATPVAVAVGDAVERHGFVYAEVSLNGESDAQ